MRNHKGSKKKSEENIIDEKTKISYLCHFPLMPY